MLRCPSVRSRQEAATSGCTAAQNKSHSPRVGREVRMSIREPHHSPFKRMKFSLSPLVVILVAVLCGRLSAADRARSPIVILISVDGLAAYNFDDPRSDIPTLRWMAAHGARAEGMESSFPSVTWPTHTTLVTGVSPGRHGVLANSYYDRAQKKKIALLPDPIFDKEELVKAPTIYDVA